VIRIIAGASEPFLRSSDRELGIVCWAQSCAAPVMGEEHLWRVRDHSCENISRGVEEVIPVMGADREPC